MLIHLLEMVTPFSMAAFPPSLQPVGPRGPALAPVSSGPCWGWTEQINVPLPLSPVLSKLVKRQQIHRDCPALLFSAARGLLESKILQNPAFAARLQAMGTSLSCSQHPRLEEFTSPHLICSICPFISAQTCSLSAPEAADKNILLFFRPLLCKIFLVFFARPGVLLHLHPQSCCSPIPLLTHGLSTLWGFFQELIMTFCFLGLVLILGAAFCRVLQSDPRPQDGVFLPSRCWRAVGAMLAAPPSPADPIPLVFPFRSQEDEGSDLN